MNKKTNTFCTKNIVLEDPEYSPRFYEWAKGFFNLCTILRKNNTYGVEKGISRGSISPDDRTKWIDLP